MGTKVTHTRGPAVVEQQTLRDILVEDARCKSTTYLADTYRQGLELAAGNPALVPWQDAMDAARIVLRERIAADWLHRNWCVTELCTRVEEHLAGHEDAARAIAEAFETERGLAEAVYRGMYPHGPITAWDTAALSKHGAFQALVGHLVAVVPSGVTA